MKTPESDLTAVARTPSPMEGRLHIYIDRARFSALLNRLNSAYGITTSDIGLVVLDGDTTGKASGIFDGFDIVPIEQLSERAAAGDVFVLASGDRDAAISRLFDLGFRNLYDGERLLRDGAPAERFAREATSLFLGPTPPTRFDPGAREASRFPCEPVQAGSVPRHKLFIVNSMPKSGTLWMTAMLERVLGIRTREQIVISHVADLETDWAKPNNHGAVCLTRDLRAVVVSWFHNAMRTDLELGFAAARYPTIEAFYDEFFLPTILGSERYYSGDLCRWLDLSGASYIPRIRYEDMRIDPLAALRKVLNAWRVDGGHEEAELAARDLTLTQMAAASGSSVYVQRMFRAGHARKGQVDGWKSELPTRIAVDIEKRFLDYQSRLGYEPYDP